jgi:hypothetical protein
MRARKPALLLAGLVACASLIATPSLAAATTVHEASPSATSTSSQPAERLDRWDSADNVLVELSKTIKDDDNATFTKWVHSFGIKLPSPIRDAEFLEMGQEVVKDKVVNRVISQFYLKKSGKWGHLYKFTVTYIDGQKPTAKLVNHEHLGNWGLSPAPLRYGFKDAAPVIAKFIKDQMGSEQAPTEVTLRKPVEQNEMLPPLIIWGVGEEGSKSHFAFDTLSGHVFPMRG